MIRPNAENHYKLPDVVIYVLARNMYNCRFYCEITTHFFQFLSIQAIAIKITIICNMSLNKKKIQQFFLLLKNKLFKLIIKWIESGLNTIFSS